MLHVGIKPDKSDMRKIAQMSTASVKYTVHHRSLHLLDKIYIKTTKQTMQKIVLTLIILITCIQEVNLTRICFDTI